MVDKILSLYLSEVEANEEIAIQLIYNLTINECDYLLISIELHRKKKECDLNLKDTEYRSSKSFNTIKGRKEKIENYRQASRALCYVSNKITKLEKIIMDVLKL